MLRPLQRYAQAIKTRIRRNLHYQIQNEIWWLQHFNDIWWMELCHSNLQSWKNCANTRMDISKSYCYWINFEILSKINNIVFFDKIMIWLWGLVSSNLIFGPSQKNKWVWVFGNHKREWKSSGFAYDTAPSSWTNFHARHSHEPSLFWLIPPQSSCIVHFTNACCHVWNLNLKMLNQKLV